jgi:hypothetical protein
MDSKFKVIHIFGFGTIQVITEDFNIQTSITKVLYEVNSCINNVWSKVPSPPIQKQYHAINIFSNSFADWQTKVKGENGFRTKYEELDDTLFQNLAQAVIDAQETLPTPRVRRVQPPVNP